MWLALIAACVIPLATAVADPTDLEQRFQTTLDADVEAKLNGLLEAQLDAQSASLLARERTRLDGLVEAKLAERLEAELDSQTAELFARNRRPAAADEVVVIANSADLATSMTCAVDDSGTLGCAAEPVCGSDEVLRPTVVASRTLSSNSSAGC